MAWLSILFCIVAALYAMVGFGGGSTYNALLYIAGVDYEIFRPVALICNLVVVTGSCVLFIRAKEFPWRMLAPFLVTSIPCAVFFASRDIPREVFLMVLGISLLLSGIRMLLMGESGEENEVPDGGRSWSVGLPIGAVLGSLAGLVSIGGGIFLAPVLHLLRWGRPHQIAATASGFIFVNSLAGLLGHGMRLYGSVEVETVGGFWPLFVAVLIGGQIGSRIGIRRLPPIWVRRMTAVLVLYVAVRMLIDVFRA